MIRKIHLHLNDNVLHFAIVCVHKELHYLAKKVFSSFFKNI